MRAAERLPALDRMRGLVMALMTVDHASDVFNQHKVTQDAYAWGANGASLYVDPGNPLHFLTRWVSHLCAPTFVFLAGAAIALSVERRLARGEGAWSIDRHLLVRGLFLVACEAWMGVGFTMPVLQVLYVIGASMVLMTLLRRLPTGLLLAAALALIGGAEAAAGALGLKPEWPPTEGFPFPHATWWGHLLLVHGFIVTPVPIPGGFSGELMVMYPLLVWLPVMMLGWAFGRWLLEQPAAEREERALRFLVRAGVAALAVFLVVRAANGYGNFWITRTDGDPLRWLQVSKYPASLAYHALELGLMALCLAGFLRLQRRGGAARENAPLLVFGQTALFYYLLHLHLMGVIRIVFVDRKVDLGQAPFGLWSAWVFAALALALLYPACRWYRGVKRRHPQSLLRYV